METVFPPGWFNVMQHLLVHLSWEARVRGPMQFRWMYSQERELKKLRYTVHNKARVDGVLRSQSRVKRLQTSQACISHVWTTWMRQQRSTMLSEMFCWASYQFFNGRVHVLGLQVHIMWSIRSGIIPCFICTRTWWKLNHILRSFKKHIGHLVCSPHWSNWITCASMGSKVVQAFRSGSDNM
jgi:hypothetical protein